MAFRQDSSSTVDSSSNERFGTHVDNSNSYKDGNYFEHRDVSNIRDERIGGTREDFTEVKQSGKQISINDSYDDTTMKNLIQNKSSDANFTEFEQRFNTAKGDIANPDDDNKGLRDGIINDTMYGFKDLSVGVDQVDQSTVSNTTSASIRTPGKGLIGGVSNEVNHRGETRSAENSQVDITRANLNRMFDDSNTANEFLDKTNNYYDEQREKAQQMLNDSDLNKTANDLEKDKQENQQKDDKSLGSIGGA